MIYKLIFIASSPHKLQIFYNVQLTTSRYSCIRMMANALPYCKFLPDTSWLQDRNIQAPSWRDETKIRYENEYIISVFLTIIDDCINSNLNIQSYTILLDAKTNLLIVFPCLGWANCEDSLVWFVMLGSNHVFL